MQNQIGEIREGLIADLVAVDGNPVADLSLLGDQGRHIPLVMKAGYMDVDRTATIGATQWQETWFPPEHPRGGQTGDDA